MNVYLRELRANYKSLIYWCVGMLAMIGGGIAKYVGYKSQGDALNDLLAKLPKAMMGLFGGGGIDLTSASGFFAMLFIYLVLLAALHAAMLGAGIISKEERDRTTEFLFVRPVTRARVITAKLLAAVTCVTVLNLFSWVFSVAMFTAMGDSISGYIAKLMIGMYVVQLIFLSVGSAIAAAMRRPKPATSITSGVLLAAFFLAMGIDMSDSLDFLKIVTPFKYFDAKNILISGFEPVYFLLSVALIVLFTALTYITYRRKDLSV